MAAMTLEMPNQMRQFDVVEQKVTRVSAGLTFSQAMNLLVQAAFSLINLTGAFHSAVIAQGSLIGSLLSDSAQDLSPEQYASMAEKIENIVRENETVITSAASIGFKPWATYLEQLKDQSEHLAGIAESFRMACDDESLTILASAAMEMQSGHSIGSGSLCGAVHA